MYDLIIIGAGPAGLTSGIYAMRAKLNTILIEKTGAGGQIALSDVIENYPGFPSISGFDLGKKFEEHARGLGLEIKFEEVEKVEDREDYKAVVTSEAEYKTKAIIIATGSQPKRLGVKGEDTFSGRGVSYCATCDGFFFRDKDVVVVGGGDTAIKEAVFLTKMAKRVTIIHRRNQLRAEKIIQEKAFSNPKVNFIWDSIVEEIAGRDSVERVITKNVKTLEGMEIPTDGVFIFVGIKPNTGFIDIEKDESGFIRTKENLETSIPGIFAAGDCRTKLLRQVSTAVGDGALAAVMAEEYIEKQ